VIFHKAIKLLNFMPSEWYPIFGQKLLAQDLILSLPALFENKPCWRWNTVFHLHHGYATKRKVQILLFSCLVLVWFGFLTFSVCFF